MFVCIVCQFASTIISSKHLKLEKSERKRVRGEGEERKCREESLEEKRCKGGNGKNS